MNDPLKKEYEAMKFLMAGKVAVKLTIPAASEEEVKAAGAVSAKFFAMRANSMIEEGLITGWTPILSEKGVARWSALKAMFEDQ